MVTQTNGKPQRKQLCDQLDRFDTMLDGLSEALNESIADAVRDGTRLALKDAVIEILTDPNLRARLQEAAAPPPVRQAASPLASGWSWLKTKFRNAIAVAKGLAFGTATVAAQTVSAVATAARNPARIGILFSSLKGLLYVGVAAGTAVALVSFFSPHAIACTISGVSGAVAAMAMRAAGWTRRAVHAIQ